jgi:hypothetical protein
MLTTIPGVRSLAAGDPFDGRYDKGLSTLNFPHKVLTTVVWSPMPHSDRQWVRTAVRGWTDGGSDLCGDEWETV